MGFAFSPITRSISVALLLCYFSFTCTEAYDKLDPNGNITIKWDVLSWTPDGYVARFPVHRRALIDLVIYQLHYDSIKGVKLWTPLDYAVVTINNFQKHRNIKAPGWTLGWTWAKKEVIWAMVGSQTTEQGDCTRFKGNIPHSCKKNPEVVDLLPGTPYNQQIADCCKAGVLSSWGKDPRTSASAFQITVGNAGTSNKTVKVPKKFTLLAPGTGYTCGPAKIIEPSKFFTPDGRRVTRALMTWRIICTYSGKPATG